MKTYITLVIALLISFTILAQRVQKIDDLADGKSDDDGSSLFLGEDSGLNDNGTRNVNVGVGFNALYTNTTGHYNTAIGARTLYSNTRGTHNTAVGGNALLRNISGGKNTANGFNALYSNTSGIRNSAFGGSALSANVTGSNNTANGYYALNKNRTGNNNTANGFRALQSNTIGKNNTAIGWGALYKNTTGHSNTSNGYQALYNNKGNQNTANGKEALHSNTTGYNNTANGYQALNANTTGYNNTAIGYEAQVTSSTASNQVRIGNTFITYAGIQVAWTITSDKRWKDNIRQLPYGLDMVMQLEPVDYTRKNNDKKTREMGFIAQDLEALLAKVGYTDQGFLTKGDDGFMSVRYNDLIALLTKALQEQQTIIEAQNEKIEAQASENVSQDTAIASLLQRMNSLETNNK